MQSKNYVPGVSGWKIDPDTGRFELNDGNRRVIALNVMITTAGQGQTNDQAADSIRAAIADEVSSRCSADEAIATNLGALSCGLSNQPFVVDGDQLFINEAAVDAGSVTTPKPSRPYSIQMQTTESGQYIAAGVGLARCEPIAEAKTFAEHVRAVIRDELRPGGLLHRW